MFPYDGKIKNLILIKKKEATNIKLVFPYDENKEWENNHLIPFSFKTAFVEYSYRFSFPDSPHPQEGLQNWWKTAKGQKSQ